jgi:hypothetical protein
MGEEALIDVFKSVGQVVGFRYRVSSVISKRLRVFQSSSFSPLCLDWYLTEIQENPEVMASVNLRVHQFILSCEMIGPV